MYLKVLTGLVQLASRCLYTKNVLKSVNRPCTACISMSLYSYSQPEHCI